MCAAFLIPSCASGRIYDPKGVAQTESNRTGFHLLLVDGVWRRALRAIKASKRLGMFLLRRGDAITHAWLGEVGAGALPVLALRRKQRGSPLQGRKCLSRSTSLLWSLLPQERVEVKTWDHRNCTTSCNEWWQILEWTLNLALQGTSQSLTIET